MAGINRYYQSTPYQGELYTPPLDLLAKSMEISQQRYDKNLQTAEAIKANYINSLPQDRARADSLQAKYNGMVEDVVKKYHGDLSQATNDLTRLKYQISKDFAPGGEAAAILGNYSNYQNWLKNSQDLAEKGKILGQDINLAHNYYMKNYTGIGDKDPVSGNYNLLQPETLTEYVDPDSIIQDVYKNFKPQKYKVGYTEFKNGQKIDHEKEFEGITPERLYPSFKQALSANPKFFNYIRQKQRFEGTDPQDVEATWDAYTQRRAHDLSYMNRSQVDKADWDAMTLLHERHRLKQQEDANFLSQLRAQYQYDPSVEVTSRRESSINPEDWRSAVRSNVEFDLPAVGPMGAVVTRKLNRGTNKYDSMGFADAIKDPDFINRTNVNAQLAETIVDKHKAKLAGDSATAEKIFKSKYGKDKAWTDKFDKEVAKDYKANEASHSRLQGMSLQIADPTARANTLLALAGQLADPGSVAVYQVGSGAIQTAADFELSAKDIIDDNKIRKDVGIAYIPGVGPGNRAAGYRLTTNKGAFVIVDQNVDRRAASEQMEAGLVDIFFHNKRFGNPMPIGSRQVGNKTQQVYAKPELRYVPNSAGGYDEQLLFHEMFPDSKGHLESTGNVIPMGLNDLYNNYLPQFEGALGSGAQKKNREFFTLYNYLFPGEDD